MTDPQTRRLTFRLGFDCRYDDLGGSWVGRYGAAVSENWFAGPVDRLLEEYTRRVDRAFDDLVGRLEIAGALAAPDFATIWSCFADEFREPIEGVAPANDLYEFGAGFIDGDPERSDLELSAPDVLTPPLAEVGLVRLLSIEHPEDAATSLGVGQFGVVLHYELTDAWRSLPAAVGDRWVNSNPYGWDSIGYRTNAEESLALTESSPTFRLARDAQPLRTELVTSSREKGTVLAS